RPAIGFPRFRLGTSGRVGPSVVVLDTTTNLLNWIPNATNSCCLARHSSWMHWPRIFQFDTVVPFKPRRGRIQAQTTDFT
ncbi:MAG TPA: hypothetical protein VMA13_09000, partial [Candidatus Saccharimonadales bacterium]|nr:hypothetical protein [Candidatus Saccharimonadales bacterium]